jgi:mannose-6-phosphate isomerase
MPISEYGERPWGTYLVLDDEPGHKVKRISVDAGKRLSYQFHELRSEHWFITSGRAVIILDGETHEVGAGAAFDIPRGAKHRIENPGPEVLIFVEVQYGDYFGEDDIIRLDDDYGRVDS